ncbi:unnamed protein product [Mytilus coruscus]|uniref:LRAT domain-containing protein n=1 Tax=Mytilus coruscus TaxID=42192 RepID=A0A6J8CSJ8_MYTCO|nr:unnamed protein product [Mytilus coruscus]
MGGIPSREVNSLGDLQPGDHIKYHRFGIAYAHHAIVVSFKAPKYTIIHFDGDKNEGKGMKASIQLESRKFCEERFEVLDYPSEHRFTKEETVAIAFYFLENGFGKYSLFGNNCEHFATTCATGYPCSIQTLRAAIAANPYFIGIPALIAYCKTKQVVSIKKLHGRFVIILLEE